MEPAPRMKSRNSPKSTFPPQTPLVGLGASSHGPQLAELRLQRREEPEERQRGRGEEGLLKNTTQGLGDGRGDDVNWWINTINMGCPIPFFGGLIGGCPNPFSGGSSLLKGTRPLGRGFDTWHRCPFRGNRWVSLVDD